ncbi:hypothetical protein CYMTET_11916 [Cymbomonas tetramitiformis]|uniref:Triacylglycerol lipase N-terminal domain-containing protein n=1 Tax=Cymbomonas tetramitiformis TaxID=36881 RepID=A0AAE0GLP1_9CHLO|nr:hypothetical protein CYMTET_11916 [Cymbomonas tetramitiformis]
MFSSDIASPADAVGAFANSFATGYVSNNLAVPDPTQWSTLQTAVAVLVTPLAIIAIIVVFSGARWSLWLLLSFTISFMRMAYSIYQGVRIMMDLGVLTAFKFGYKIATLFSTTKKSLLTRPFSQSREPRVLQARISCATSYEEYLAAANQLDSIEGLDKWRTDDSDFHQASLLRETTAKLAALRYNGDLRGLQYLLSGLLKRNHLGIDNPEMHTAYRCHSKLVIERFHAEVECCLKHITLAESIPLEDRLQFMQKARPPPAHASPPLQVARTRAAPGRAYIRGC